MPRTRTAAAPPQAAPAENEASQQAEERKRAKPRTSVQVALTKFEEAKRKLDIANAYANCKAAPKVLEKSMRDAVQAGDREAAQLALQDFLKKYVNLIDLELPAAQPEPENEATTPDEPGEN